MVSFKSSVAELVNAVKVTPAGVLVSTFSGAGNVVAEFLDEAKIGNTIAGDNTILVIGSDEAKVKGAVSEFKQTIASLIKGVKSTPLGVIVSTTSGAGSIVAELIDQAKVANTIAGDNTILVIGSDENKIKEIIK